MLVQRRVIERQVNTALFTNILAVQNLMAHPHGRRMICGMLAVSPPEQAPEAFFDAMERLEPVEQDEIRKFLRGHVWDSADTGGAIKCGFIKKVDTGSPHFGAFLFRAQEDTPSNVDGLSIAALANPVFTADAIEKAWASAAPKAKDVLLFNPNIDRAHRAGMAADEITPSSFLACIEYGDLADPFIAKTL